MMTAADTLSLALAQSAETSQTIWEFIESGGALMVPIGICSVLVLAFALERFLALSQLRMIPGRIAGPLKAIAEGDLAAAEKELEGDKSPVARVLAVGLRRQGYTLRDVEGAMEDQAYKELEKERRNIRPLAVIAGVAPLMGLLGTVMGIAESFRRVSQAGMGKPEVLAGGIEMALTTTIAGLLVAIPALLLAAWLHARLRRLMLRLDERVSPAVEKIAAPPEREESHAA